MRIQIIEDDKVIREELAKLLEKNGYQVITTPFYDPQTELSLPLDLILLDVNLPSQDGYTICQEIRKKSKVPIIFVTSRDSDNDELKSILSGGNDFIKKPYNKLVLLEKIKRTLKGNDPINYKDLCVKDMTLDLHLSLLCYKNQQVELTRNEFKIAYYFFLHPGKIITKETLIEYLWNDKYYLDENILLVNMNRLRKKASSIGIKDFIETIRKEGYRL